MKRKAKVRKGKTRENASAVTRKRVKRGSLIAFCLDSASTTRSILIYCIHCLIELVQNGKIIEGKEGYGLRHEDMHKTLMCCIWISKREQMLGKRTNCYTRRVEMSSRVPMDSLLLNRADSEVRRKMESQ